MEPSHKLVKMENYDIQPESMFTVDISASMHTSNQYSVGQPNFIDSSTNRDYVAYSGDPHISVQGHRNIQVDAHGRQMRSFDSIIKSENESNVSHTSEYDASSVQFNFVDVTSEVNPTNADADDIPIILNGKYFSIIEEMNATEHQRVTRGIVAVCQHCPREKVRSIQGSMRITSNFVRHLKTLHPAKYEEFVIERQNHARTPRSKRGPKRKSSQLEGQGAMTNESSMSKPDGCYMDDDSNVQSSDGAGGGYYDDIPQLSANNVDNTDMYSAESNDTRGSEESMEKKGSAAGSSSLLCDPNEIPTILNGKFFKIVDHDFHSNRASISVVAACQFCEKDKMVKGPLKVTSNFVQHLRLHHFKEYNMYLQEKFSSSSRCRRLANNKPPAQLPFIEKVLNFVLACNVPVSVVEESTFIDLFRGAGLTMCTTAQLLARLDEIHTDFVESIKRNLEEVPYICATADIWISKRKQYLGYCIFWLDNDLKRQMSVLACVRLSNAPDYKEIQALIRQIHSKYDISDEKITSVIVDGVNDFVETYHNFSIESICPDSSSEYFNFSTSNSQNLLLQLPNHFERGEESLHLLTVLDFNNILKSHETLSQLLKRCLHILQQCKEFESDEIAGFEFDGHLESTDTRWLTWYAWLTQLIKQKHKLDELCTCLNTPNFTSNDLEYLEEFCMLLKPMADALEFLQQDTTLYYGYFLPTLITIKVKLKKLRDCRRIKHLQMAAQEMSDALLKRFRKYFEVKSECNNAIIAAIVCPAIKMRFIEALHENAPNVTTETFIKLFIDYGQEFRVDDDNQADSNGSEQKRRPPSVDSFLCFDPDDNGDLPSEHKPDDIIRKEITNYLHDDDKTLACLNRYPLVKKVFHKYNTLPPTSITLENFFQTFLNVSDGQRGQKLSEEHFERLILTKANKVL